MYEPSKHIATYHIAGFQHWDGALVLDQLKPGTPLTLAIEPDNPYDPEAVALFFDSVKLGYIPANESSLPFLMSYFGHDVFELRVLQIDSQATPWKQVRVGLYIKDKR